MISSFNAFGTVEKDYSNLHRPIWLGNPYPVPVGGSVASGYLKKQVIYPAGFPVNLTNKVITPLIAWEVVSFTAATGSETVDTIVIKPRVLGAQTFLPSVGDVIQKIGATFATAGKAAVVASIVEITEGTTKGCYSVTVLHSATIDNATEGDFITISAATDAGSDKSIKVQPNGYLYNDIFMGDIDVTAEDAGATGAVIEFHSEGILIDLTDMSGLAAQMKAAVPHVLQVSV